MANINKNIIMQAGAAVANATNKAAGLSASTPEPGSIISAIQLVNGGREIGPSALAHFTESVRNKLLSLLVSMEPIQDFNGYGHPWPAGGGVNLLPNALPTGTINATIASSGYISSATNARVFAIPCKANTDYTFQQNATGSAWTTIGFSTVVPAVGNTIDRRGNMTNRASWTQNSGNNTFIVMEFSNSSGFNNVVTTREGMVFEGTGSKSYSPYENICPISGRTGLDIYAGPTDSIGDAATYSMDWTSPAGTVYAGSADIVTGDIKAAPYYASYNGETLVGPWVSSMDVYDPEVTPTTGAQVVDLGVTMTEYHITGQDIITLVGDNYIWSDSGDVTITE